MTDNEARQVAEHIPLIVAVIVGGALGVGLIIKTIRGIDTQIEDAVTKETTDLLDKIKSGTESFHRDLEHHTREEAIWQDAIVERLDRQDATLDRIEKRLDRISQRFTMAALKALGEEESPSEE